MVKKGPKIRFNDAYHKEHRRRMAKNRAEAKRKKKKKPRKRKK